MEPKFEDWPALTIVGLSTAVQPTRTEGIPALWRVLRPRLSEIGGWDGERTFGVAYNVQPGGFDYLAGVAMVGEDSVPEGMTRLELTPQHYAVFTHRLDGRPLPETLPGVMGYIFKTWLPASGYSLAAAPELELYDSRFDNQTWGGEMDVLIPVTPKS